MNTHINKGFTLIELLIVIGIIAVLATAVLLVLNPAQILAESRDTQRLSDLDTVRSALNLSASATSSLMFNTGGSANGACSFNIDATSPDGVACTAPATPRSITGNGWVKVDISAASVGQVAAIATYPVDPTNSNSYPYWYKGSNAVNGTFELDARLESTKHRAKMQNDGGSSNVCGATFIDQTCWYEVGTNLAL